mmetsp:Transcript_695/g.954  ORF Transcript_695/g.954 Transcript_695/m.954 type:complete len:398 (-) Transcript_695:22-1215(-)
MATTNHNKLNPPPPILVHGALAFTQLLWSSMTVWSKAGLEHVHPSIFLVLRLGGSALLLQVMNITTYFVHKHKQQGKTAAVENRSAYAKLDEPSDSSFTGGAQLEVRLLPRGKEWGWLLLLSFFGIISFTGSYTMGLHYSTATNTVIIDLATIVWASTAAILLKRERFHWLKVAGVVIAIAGGLVMSEIDKFEFKGDAFIGNMFLIYMSFAFGFYLVFGDFLYKQMHSLLINSWINTFAAIFYLFVNIFFFKDEWNNFTSAPTQAYFSIVWTVVVGTVVAYQIYSWAMQHTTPLVSSIYFPFQTLAGMILAAFFLGEELTFHVVAGGLMVGLGVALVLISKSIEENRARHSIVDFNSIKEESDSEMFDEEMEETAMFHSNEESTSTQEEEVEQVEKV